MKKVKSINALMRYLRDTKNISIAGSSDKQKLRNMGYYHGYKGYRFYRDSSNRLAYTDFSQLLAVYRFDMQLKSLFYSPLMQIETALKNRALEIVLEKCASESFDDLCSMLLTHHEDYPESSGEYKKMLRKETVFRNRIKDSLKRDYSKKRVISHFREKDRPVPVWAVFEVLGLGDFGTMLACMNNSVAREIADASGIDPAFNPDGRLLEELVFTVKDLRNAVAHNDAIFDVRFMNQPPDEVIVHLLTDETGIPAIDFDTITDHVILVAYLMKCLTFPKAEIRRLVSGFRDLYEEMGKKVPSEICALIVRPDTRLKIQRMLRAL